MHVQLLSGWIFYTGPHAGLGLRRGQQAGDETGASHIYRAQGAWQHQPQSISPGEQFGRVLHSASSTSWARGEEVPRSDQNSHQPVTGLWEEVIRSQAGAQPLGAGADHFYPEISQALVPWQL